MNRLGSFLPSVPVFCPSTDKKGCATWAHFFVCKKMKRAKWTNSREVQTCFLCRPFYQLYHFNPFLWRTGNEKRNRPAFEMNNVLVGERQRERNDDDDVGNWAKANFKNGERGRLFFFTFRRLFLFVKNIELYTIHLKFKQSQGEGESWSEVFGSNLQHALEPIVCLRVVVTLATKQNKSGNVGLEPWSRVCPQGRLVICFTISQNSSDQELVLVDVRSLRLSPLVIKHASVER